MLHPRGLLLMLAGLSAVACGARSELHRVEPAGDAEHSRPDASDTPDAAVIRDARVDVLVPEDSAIEPPDSGPCTWGAGTRTLVSEGGRGDQTASGTIALGGEVFVAYTNNNDPSPDPNWYVRVLDENGRSRGPANAIFTHQGSRGGMSLASSAGRLAALAWDEGGGCRFIALTPSGAAGSTPLRESDRSCRGLRGGINGFTFFEDNSPPDMAVTLARTDVRGQILRRGSVVIPAVDRAVWYARATAVDGSFAVAWLDNGLMPSRLRFQLFDFDSPPLGPTRDLLRLDVFAASTRIVATASGYIVAWVQENGPGIRDRHVALLPLDRDGTPRGGPVTVPESHSVTRHEIALANVRGTILVAWNDEEPMGVWPLWVRPLDADGNSTGPRFRIDGIRASLDHSIVATPAGALLLLTAAGSGANQVFAVTLRCQAR